MSTEFEHWHHDSQDVEATEREHREHLPARPGFGRSLLGAYVIAAVIGLVIGLVWAIAGLLRFHPLW